MVITSKLFCKLHTCLPYYKAPLNLVAGSLPTQKSSFDIVCNGNRVHVSLESMKYNVTGTK